jgi:hypothetical protein
MANDIVSDESDCTSEEFLLDCARGPCNYDHKKWVRLFCDDVEV